MTSAVPQTGDASSPKHVATVLVAESDRNALEVIRSTLESAGYRVLPVTNGHDALVVSRQYIAPVDLLISELEMPDLSGIEFAALLVKDRPELKIILACDSISQCQTPELFGQLGWRLLERPFAPGALIKAVRELTPTDHN